MTASLRRDWSMWTALVTALLLACGTAAEAGSPSHVNNVKVLSDKSNSRYRVKYRPMQEKVEWPATTMEELLGRAVGEDKLITSADHELYSDLVSGETLK